MLSSFRSADQWFSPPIMIMIMIMVNGGDGMHYTGFADSGIGGGVIVSHCIGALTTDPGQRGSKEDPCRCFCPIFFVSASKKRKGVTRAGCLSLLLSIAKNRLKEQRVERGRL